MRMAPETLMGRQYTPYGYAGQMEDSETGPNYLSFYQADQKDA